MPQGPSYHLDFLIPIVGAMVQWEHRDRIQESESRTRVIDIGEGTRE